MTARVIAVMALCLTWLIPVSVMAQTPGPSASKFTESLATADQVRDLQFGGFVLYLRHGKSDSSRADRVPAVDLNDCATQRPLTEEGRQEAARVGDDIRRLHIPIGTIHASPLCRVRDTLAAAFPALPVTVDGDLIYTANMTAAQKIPILSNTRKLLSSPVDGQTNRLVAAHAPNLMDLMGYFPKEMTLVIFRPHGNQGFTYIASIPVSHWSKL